MRFGTKVIHAGIEPDATTGAIMTPIFQTSTFVQDAIGVNKGYEYARTRNPTRDALQNNLAALENGNFGVCFSSGMAAVDAVMKLMSAGDEVISTNDLYGGSYRTFVKIFERFGMKFHFIPMQGTVEIEEKINKNTKMLWLETPTNPMLNIIDIKEICKLAKAHNLLVCVDNTFASPYLQNPLDLGADIVLHSATKYIGGHSDVIHGAVICNDEEIAKQLYFLQNGTGAVPGPQDCFLVLRGIKTLHLRMERACQNANQIAQYLTGNSNIQNVFYPGLPDHPSHTIASQQMRDFGAMVSFTLKNDTLEAASHVMENTKLFSLAESLGGVESLIGHPPTMTHGSIPRAERLAIGMTDSLIRLSVGIEDVKDLIDDLDKAFLVING